MAPNHQEYVPGVCNIGPAERRTRRIGGIAGIAATILIFIGLLVADAPVWWRLILIVPASAAATGFIQDAMHFCAGFGLQGLYNVIHSTGVTDSVDAKEFRLADKRKAVQIIIYSIAIGLIVTAVSLFVPL